MAKRLPTSLLSADELRRSKFPEAFITDYLNIASNLAILSTQFQWLKAGTQATTASFEPLTGFTTDRNTGGFTLDSATGEITIPETGDYKLDCQVYGSASTGLEIKAQLYRSGAWTDMPGAVSNAASHVAINGYLFSASVSQKVRIVIKDTGGTMDIVTDAARITIGRKS